MAITTTLENTTAIEVSNLDTQGAFNYPTTSGVPAAGTAVGQRAYDPTANILYTWDGSVWQTIGGATGREILTAARTYYVDPAGSDSNDGLTVGTPFLTLNKAYTVVTREIDLAGNAVTIQLADGDYFERAFAAPYVGLGSVTWQGNSTTPSNVRIYGIAAFATKRPWFFKGMELYNASGALVQAFDSDYIDLDDIVFADGTTGACVQLFNSTCKITPGTTLSAEGAIGIFFDIQRNSFLELDGSSNITIDFPTPAATITTFINTQQSRVENGSRITFTNLGNVAVTNKFSIKNGAHYNSGATSGQLNNTGFLPGTVAGTFDGSSSYDDITLFTGRNVETLAAAKTLVDGSDVRTQILDPGGANRDVNLPASGTLVLGEYLVINPAGSGFNLILKDGGGTLSTIVPGSQAAAVYDGSSWISI